MDNLIWLLVLAMAVSLLGAFLRNPSVKGRMGETAVRSRLNDELDDGVYTEFHDLIIPSRNGTTQIDHIYISKYGIFVVETKNYTGWIFGGEKQARWTQVVYKEKHYFQNPLRQNYAHIKALAALLNLPESKFHSLAAFLGDCEFKTEMPPNVCRLRSAAKYIKSFQTALLDEGQIHAVIALLSSDEYRADKEKLREHTARLRERHRH
nr:MULTISPECIES: nuclease-related domain-containing protein [unclassified Neisseria]